MPILTYAAHVALALPPARTGTERASPDARRTGDFACPRPPPRRNKRRGRVVLRMQCDGHCSPPPASLLAALVPIGPQHALACSCAASELDEALARSLVANADALITGRVKHVSGERDDLVAWVAVEREFKGSGRRELVVQTGGLCAYSAMREASRHFLVLYHERGRRFKLHLCSGSIPMNSADGRADFGPNAEFLAGLTRIAPPARPGDGSALSSIWIAAGLAGALAAFAALAAMKRKRRAPFHR